MTTPTATTPGPLSMSIQTGTTVLGDPRWPRYALLDAEAKTRAPWLYSAEAAHNAHGEPLGAAEHEVRVTWPLVPPNELPALCTAQVEAARQAVDDYRRLSLGDRIDLVRALGARLLSRLEQWRELTVQEGYTYNTFVTSLDSIAQVFDEDYLRFIAARLRPAPKGPYARLEHVPYGVVGVVVPSNASFPMLTQVIHGALLSGNAVIAKPSQRLAGVALQLVAQTADVLAEFGAPSAMVSSIVSSSSHGIMDAWLGAGGIDQLVYIGCSRRRDELLARCRDAGITQPLLEFEGVDAAYVHDDLDDEQLDRVARVIAYAKNVASGQYCVSLERLYVADGVYERFMERLVAEFRRYRPGPLRQDDPLVTNPCARATTLRQVVTAFVAEGGHVRCGGRRLDVQGHEDPQGIYVEPTVIECGHARSELLQQELFMPVLPVVRVRGGVEEATHLIGLTKFGLRASVHANDAEVIQRFEAATEAGTIIVNGNHLDFSIQIAGGRGGTTLDQHARIWALDLSLRRVRVDGAPVREADEIIERARRLQSRLAGAVEAGLGGVVLRG